MGFECGFFEASLSMIDKGMSIHEVAGLLDLSAEQVEMDVGIKLNRQKRHKNRCFSW